MKLNKLTAKNLAFVATLLGIFTGLASATTAQSINSVDKDPYQSNEKNPNGDIGNFMNPLELMHRANLERSRSGSEFAEDTHNNLNEAAESFREMQRQRLETELRGVSEEANP